MGGVWDVPVQTWLRFSSPRRFAAEWSLAITEAGTIRRSVALPRRIGLVLGRIDLVTAVSAGVDLNGIARPLRPVALLAVTFAAALGVGFAPERWRRRTEVPR